MKKPKICVSFDYENDKESRNAIRLWNSNNNIDFDIVDTTPTEIDTYRIDKIKAGLSTKISDSDILLVISGQYINQPHKDKKEIECINWQNWECKKALELNKKIILVKLQYYYDVPKELYGKSREEVIGLELNKIKSAINNLLVH